MSDSVWARLRGHRWLPQATAVVVLAALVAGFFVVRAERRADHNAAVLARACGGVLPRDAVRDLLSGDVRWELRTGAGPRALAGCAVGGTGEDEPRLEFAAVPLADPPLKGVRAEDLAGDTPYASAPEWAREHERADTQVTVACPAGLPGHPRRVTGFRVYASLVGGPEAAAELGPAVAALANDVRERNRCGGVPVRPSDARAPAPARDDGGEREENPAPCRWFGGKTESAAGGEHAWARGCAIGLPATDVHAVSSASWWGDVLPEARTEYGAELAGLGGGAPASAVRRSYEVAAWARSRCAQGTTLHRVSVSGLDKAALAARVDGLLDRYLAAATGCRDVEVLGKVWA
ncbi:hypothetical protein [Streptomyces sp. MS191]|uniref:hypothetical protein n=1 Tax=Streptomyces sp. ms191 TaxID=1827978 RepID=UPI0011CE5498|nr:hypothetical protein [Streptomyces sp. ms191]